MKLVCPIRIIVFQLVSDNFPVDWIRFDQALLSFRWWAKDFILLKLSHILSHCKHWDFGFFKVTLVERFQFSIRKKIAFLSLHKVLGFQGFKIDGAVLRVAVDDCLVQIIQVLIVNTFSQNRCKLFFVRFSVQSSHPWLRQRIFILSLPRVIFIPVLCRARFQPVVRSNNLTLTMLALF